MGSYQPHMPSRNADLPNSLIGYYDYCCIADASLFGRICHRVYSHVRYFPPFLLSTHNDRSCSASSSFQTENSPRLKTKRTPGVQITLPPMEVSVQTASEQCPVSQLNLDIDEKQNDKPNKMAIDHDLEIGV